MNRSLLTAALIGLMIVFTAFPTRAGIPDRNLKVGISMAPPYIINTSGVYSGICIDLWRMICDSMKIGYQYVYYTDNSLLMRDLKAGKIDMTICPLTITSERLHQYSIFLPFTSTNTGIVSRADETRPLFMVLRNLMSWTVLRSVLIVLIIVSLFAVLLWLVERRANPEHYHHGIRGIGDGMWWAIVTMTTVGYGDKVPRSVPGRMLSVIWMFFAIGLFFIVSGVVSSQLTVVTLETEIKSTRQLSSERVGTVYQSGYAETLRRNNIPHTVFFSPVDGLRAVSSGLIDTFVFDEAMLKYLVDRYKIGKHVRFAPSILNTEFLCFMAGKKNTGLVDAINPVLLNAIESQSWHETMLRYQVAP